MASGSSELLLRGEVACPACGARQALSDACRRCRTDLSLVRRVASSWLAERERCLTELAAGRLESALTAARRCFELSPGAEAARLLAVCQLLNRNYAAALGAYRRAAPNALAFPDD